MLSKILSPHSTSFQVGSSSIWFAFTFAIISQISCQIANDEFTSKFCSQSKNAIKLDVFNQNVWGLSYFDDFPMPSASEPFDVSSARQSLLGYLNGSYPNPVLIPMFQGLDDARLIGLLNSARKKQERLDALCEHLIEQEFDVAFMQEVWFKDDYNFLKNCTALKYHISKFDEECGRLNEMTVLECSGLVTLVKRSKESKLKETFIAIPKGNDFATISDPALYGDGYISSRKALIVDAMISEVPLRLINTHLTPYNSDFEQNRQLRTQQADFICNEALQMKREQNWLWAIFGLDMNEVPGDNSVYQTFLDCGFSDAYNPGQSDATEYPPTYATIGNTWTDTVFDTVTIDYILAKSRNTSSSSNYTMYADFEKVVVEDLKTVISNVSISDHNSVFASLKLGCSSKIEPRGFE